MSHHAIWQPPSTEHPSPSSAANVDRWRLQREISDWLQSTEVPEADRDLIDADIRDCALGNPQARERMETRIREQLRLRNIDDETLVQEIYVNEFGLGAIDPLSRDNEISEIWVNGPNDIFVDKDGRTVAMPEVRFRSELDLMRVIRSLLIHEKESITTKRPGAKAIMYDGSRITVAIPPIADTPTLSIRRFQSFVATPEALIDKGTINEELHRFFGQAMRGRSNANIIGATSAGKTSFLRYLMQLIDPELRLGFFQTQEELHPREWLPGRNIFSYIEEETIGWTLAQLIALGLRSRPDVMIVGEVIKTEADAMIQGMRRGHMGLSSFHTHGPGSFVDDFADVIMMDGVPRDLSHLRYWIASAHDLLIHMHRFPDGVRRVHSVTEVAKDAETRTYSLRTLFQYVEGNGFVKMNEPTEALQEKWAFAEHGGSFV